MKQGFTLLELSIVLVIIGLIVGGVTAGSSLIRAAELNSIGSDVNKYKVAVNTFKLKYNALPGDMKDAVSYWGRSDDGTFSGQCANPLTNLGTGTQTCNGNGNGKVEYDPNFWEKFGFWKHLVNSEILEGSFSGIGQGSQSAWSIPGYNIPKARFGNAAIDTMYWGTFGSGFTLLIAYGHTFSVGAQAGENNAALDPALSPSDAKAVDMKYDDGMPGKGIVIAAGWDTCTDAATNTSYDGEYLLSENDLLCALHFRNQY